MPVVSPILLLASIPTLSPAAAPVPLKGETGPGRFHDAVARGLLESVRGLTDGQDPHHPLIVISVAEQFAYLRAIGLEFDEQELGSCNARPCERIRATDPSTSESVTLYFDVTIQMEWLAAHSRK